MRKSRKQQQRLLRNMGAHAVVLELLQIPYEKVGRTLTMAAAPEGGPGPSIFLNLSCLDTVGEGMELMRLL